MTLNLLNNEYIGTCPEKFQTSLQEIHSVGQ